MAAGCWLLPRPQLPLARPQPPVTDWDRESDRDRARAMRAALFWFAPPCRCVFVEFAYLSPKLSISPVALATRMAPWRRACSALRLGLAFYYKSGKATHKDGTSMRVILRRLYYVRTAVLCAILVCATMSLIVCSSSSRTSPPSSRSIRTCSPR